MKVNAALFTAFVVLSSVLTMGCGPTATELLPLISSQTPTDIRSPWGDSLPEPAALQSQPLSLPFPERENPFLFPQDRVLQAVPTPEVNEVKVLGFVQVDQPRVLLRVANSTRTLAVGDKTQGVEVVAIEPPTVRLRQGNLTWNASLFD